MKHLTPINRKAARVETVTAHEAPKDVVALQGPPQQPEPPPQAEPPAPTPDPPMTIQRTHAARPTVFVLRGQTHSGQAIC